MMQLFQDTHIFIPRLAFYPNEPYVLMSAAPNRLCFGNGIYISEIMLCHNYNYYCGVENKPFFKYLFFTIITFETKK